MSLNALADAPSGPSALAHPLDVTNVDAPFQPNGANLLRGTGGRAAVVTVDRCLSATRIFTVGDVAVHARSKGEL